MACIRQLGSVCHQSRGRAVAPVVRQRVLTRAGINLGDSRASVLDIHTLLVRPDPSRSLKKTYRTISQLGKGGFGSVFRVEYLPTGQERAIKLLTKPSDAIDLERVMTEVELLVKLDHPNIEKFFEFFEDDKVLCLVTELCLGGNLGELNPYDDTEEDIRLLFHDVVAAVSFCHSQGVVHRDLKFENCLLTKPDHSHRRVAKIIDFGLSAMRPPTEQGDRWMDEAVGTVYFIAPEVIKSELGWRQKYGTKCDMWSIGVMLYIVYTDEHPFARSAAGVSQILKGIKCHHVRSEPLLKGVVPPLAKSLMLALLERDPEVRLSGAEALAHAYFREGARLPMTREHEISPSSMRSMFARISSFSHFSRFEKALLTIVAHDARTRQVEQLRRAFSALDPDGAGWLTREGITAVLKSKGMQLSDERIREVFQALDPDQDDKIMYTDWLAATIQPCLLMEETAIREVFDFFDIHGHEKVSRADLLEVLGQEAFHLGNTSEPLPEEWSLAEGEVEHEVTWDEFRQLIRRLAGNLQSRENKATGEVLIA